MQKRTYTVRAGEDLGSIAQKFGMPSWKYLYALNTDVIGDNPDLLKEGTKLTIPLWDHTSGDELIREKGGDPYAYTGGLRYRYPWVPLSMTLTDDKGDFLKLDKDQKYQISSETTGVILKEGTISNSEELEMLLPDEKHLKIQVGTYVLSKKSVSNSSGKETVEMMVVDVSLCNDDNTAASGEMFQVIDSEKKVIGSGNLDAWGKASITVPKVESYEVVFPNRSTVKK